MKKITETCIVVILAILILSTLIGCSNLLVTPKDTMIPPKGTRVEEQTTEDIESIIKSFLPKEAKFQIPSTPTGADAIQFGDMDGDGGKEMLVTYKLAQEPESVYAMLFKMDGATWNAIWQKRFEGYDVDWAGFIDLEGSGRRQLMIGAAVGLSAGNILSAFSLDDDIINEYFTTMYHKLELVELTPKGEEKPRKLLGIWTKDTGDAFVVDVLKWTGTELAPAKGVYPVYFKKIVEYYEERTKANPEAALYWYYLADAQIKINDTEGAMNSIENGLKSNQEYPGKEKFLELRNQIKQ